MRIYNFLPNMLQGNWCALKSSTENISFRSPQGCVDFAPTTSRRCRRYGKKNWKVIFLQGSWQRVNFLALFLLLLLLRCTHAYIQNVFITGRKAQGQKARKDRQLEREEDRERDRGMVISTYTRQQSSTFVLPSHWRIFHFGFVSFTVSFFFFFSWEELCFIVISSKGFSNFFPLYLPFSYWE